MLTDAMVSPTLPVVDIKRAKKFYEDKLGLKTVMEDPSPGAMLQAGQGTMLYIYQRAATKADHTVASFAVDNIESKVKELKGKGIKFEEYDIPAMKLKTVNSIATMDGMKTAWFKDTEGNILALAQMPKAKEDEIRLIAYSLWEEENCPDGRDCEHWFRAEAIWEQNQQKQKVEVRNVKKGS